MCLIDLWLARWMPDHPRAWEANTLTLEKILVFSVEA
jgi:hypothetical protein